MENKRSRPAFSLRKRFGTTNYRVNAYCSDSAAETFEAKTVRFTKMMLGMTAAPAV